MGKEIQATIIKVDSTDITSVSNHIEELQKQLADKEQAANRARRDLEKYENSARAALKDQPALLAELEAELAESARRREEKSTREARVEVLRKQSTTIRH